MKALLRALVLGATLFAFATAAQPAELPYKTFSEIAQKAAVINSGLGLCPDAQGMPSEVFFAAFTLPEGKEMYAYWFAPANGRLVVAVFPSPQATYPTEVGVGRVDEKAHDVVPALKWRKFEPEMPGPCQLLFPPEA